MDVADLAPGQVEHASRLLEHVFTELAACAGERDVLQRAAALLAELAGADVVAVCEGTQVHAGVGLGQRFLPERGLARVLRDRGGSFTVSGLGRVRTVVVDVPGLNDVNLVVGRSHEFHEAPDLTEALSAAVLVARILGLEVLGRHRRERERRHHQQGALQVAERIALQRALRQREQMLTTSVRFQRAISSRRPLPELLLQIARSSSELMDSRAVTLVLADPRSQMQMRVVAAVGEPALEPHLALAAAADVEGVGVNTGGDGQPAAAAVHINGRSVGALVVETSINGSLDSVGATVLRAFAEHASMALSHADTVRAVEAATSDPLTGLPNRAALLRHLELSLRVSASDGLGTAVLFIDLNGFKGVNDSLGHAAGDDVLTRVARRLRRCLRGDDIATRLGGDEFALVVRDAEARKAAQRIAARVRKEVAVPLETHGTTVRVGASIGIALAERGLLADDLLRRADTAMYRAKAASRKPACGRGPAAGTDGAGPTLPGAVVFFEEGMHDADQLRRQLEQDLPRAVDEDQFELDYQPIVRLGDGTVVGAEATLRLRDRAHGLPEAEDFLAVAERFPDVEQLWRWMLRTACVQAADWRRRVPQMSVSVNLSAAHVMARGAADDVRWALAEAGLDAAGLVLEVPSALLVEDPDVLATRLEKLRATGARVLLGDFAVLDPGRAGVLAGHSLAPLRQLAVDGVKLHRSLIGEIDGPDGADALAAVRMLCELGAALDLGVVAEGVERTEQVLLLQEVGCAVGQGPVLGLPRPGGELAPEVATGGSQRFATGRPPALAGQLGEGAVAPLFGGSFEGDYADERAGGPVPAGALLGGIDGGIDAQLDGELNGEVVSFEDWEVVGYEDADVADGLVEELDEAFDRALGEDSPAPVPISGVRPTDVRALLDRSR